MLSFLILCLFYQYGGSTKSVRSFPKDFLFGSATSAYQIEGAWNVDGKSENIWDHLTHTNPSSIKDSSNGDIATDSYHNYKRDVEMVRELGLDFYRFSLSWSRILPNGHANNINKAGVDFYNNYINEIIKYNITPFVTLYHWDMPQNLQVLGGLSNPLITEWYEDYARVAFELFGDRVKHWITFNEPFETCNDGYGGVTAAPMLNSSGVADYLCIKNILLSHARAYHLYDAWFRPVQGGEVGITFSVPWFIAHTDSAEDKVTAELQRQISWGLIADPIFSSQGGFPKELLKRVAEKSYAQGYPRSRLQDFSDEERIYIRGTHDFMGVNYYRNAYISATQGLFNHPQPSMLGDVNAGLIVPDEWWKSTTGKLELPPHGIRNILLQLKDKYNSTIYITENGIPTSGDLNDDERAYYYKMQLNNTLDALDAGVNLKGYSAWSLMDNFEWIRGYTERYGMYQVNFTDPKRPRTPRKSAFVFKKIVSTRTIDFDYEPDANEVMQIDADH